MLLHWSACPLRDTVLTTVAGLIPSSESDQLFRVLSPSKLYSTPARQLAPQRTAMRCRGQKKAGCSPAELSVRHRRNPRPQWLLHHHERPETGTIQSPRAKLYLRCKLHKTYSASQLLDRRLTVCAACPWHSQLSSCCSYPSHLTRLQCWKLFGSLGAGLTSFDALKQVSGIHTISKQTQHISVVICISAFQSSTQGMFARISSVV